MQKHDLSFGVIIIHYQNLAELIVNPGVEMDLEMVGEYHEFLLTKMQHPLSILINKLYPYTYTFEAQQHLGTLTQINSVAILVYGSITKKSTECLISIPRSIPWSVKIFTERSQALDWLERMDNNITNHCVEPFPPLC